MSGNKYSEEDLTGALYDNLGAEPSAPLPDDAPPLHRGHAVDAGEPEEKAGGAYFSSSDSSDSGPEDLPPRHRRRHRRRRPYKVFKDHQHHLRHPESHAAAHAAAWEGQTWRGAARAAGCSFKGPILPSPVQPIDPNAESVRFGVVLPVKPGMTRKDLVNQAEDRASDAYSSKVDLSPMFDGTGSDTLLVLCIQVAGHGTDGLQMGVPYSMDLTTKTSASSRRRSWLSGKSNCSAAGGGSGKAAVLVVGGNPHGKPTDEECTVFQIPKKCINNEKFRRHANVDHAGELERAMQHHYRPATKTVALPMPDSASRVWDQSALAHLALHAVPMIRKRHLEATDQDLGIDAMLPETGPLEVPAGALSEVVQQIQEESGAQDFLLRRGDMASFDIRRLSPNGWADERNHLAATSGPPHPPDGGLQRPVGAYLKVVFTVVPLNR